MTLNIDTIADLVDTIGGRDTFEVIRLAKKQTQLEVKWQNKMKAEIERITDEVLANASRTGRLKLDGVDFLPFLMEHSFTVTKEGILSTKKPNPVRGDRLAAPPKGIIPKDLGELREWWDAWRKKKAAPARQKTLAEKLRKAYLERIQATWRQASQEFLSGDTARNTAAVEFIKREAGVVYSRAKMIVETETTYYFNRVRRNVYDKTPDVTHYLFLAIRDHATTKWCKTRNGLVYAKTDPLLNRETPPVHWNCRSELLPLTAHNPNHRRLIEDKQRARRNNRCEPLPKEWAARP